MATGTWGLYANFTTAAQLPDDAGWAAKMLADPPIYLPWLAFVLFAALLAWAFWPSPDNDEGPSSAVSTSGPNSPNILGDDNTVAIGDGAKIMGDDNRKGIINHAPNLGTQNYYEAPQISPQDALKRDLRNLLAAADGRILFEIDRGHLDIETRMTAAQFSRLEEICATLGSATLMVKADITGRFVNAVIDDGTFGPSTAEPEQIRVKFQFTSEICE